LAFSDLGKLLRHAEDRTFIGTLEKRYLRGINPRTEPEDVLNSFEQGANIVNLDEFIINDERLLAVLWSWELPNDDLGEVKIKDGCAIQKSNRR